MKKVCYPSAAAHGKRRSELYTHMPWFEKTKREDGPPGGGYNCLVSFQSVRIKDHCQPVQALMDQSRNARPPDGNRYIILPELLFPLVHSYRSHEVKTPTHDRAVSSRSPFALRIAETSAAPSYRHSRRLPLAFLDIFLQVVVKNGAEQEEKRDTSRGTKPGGVGWVLFDGAYQSFHRAVKRVPMVSPEFGIGAFEGGVAVGFGLFDAGGVSELGRLASGAEKEETVRNGKGGDSEGDWEGGGKGGSCTRCGELSCFGCVVKNSSILCRFAISGRYISRVFCERRCLTGHCDGMKLMKWVVRSVVVVEKSN